MSEPMTSGRGRTGLRRRGRVTVRRCVGAAARSQPHRCRGDRAEGHGARGDRNDLGVRPRLGPRLLRHRIDLAAPGRAGQRRRRGRACGALDHPERAGDLPGHPAVVPVVPDAPVAGDLGEGLRCRTALRAEVQPGAVGREGGTGDLAALVAGLHHTGERHDVALGRDEDDLHRPAVLGHEDVARRRRHRDVVDAAQGIARRAVPQQRVRLGLEVDRRGPGCRPST